MLAETWALIRRDILLEWRTKYAIGGILLYVFSTLVIVFLAIARVEPPVWNAVFWIVLLFAAVNAILKGFVQEHSSRHLYYYSLFNPVALLLAKTIYNAALLLVLGLLSWLVLSVLTTNPVADTGLFLLTLFLGGTGLSIALTFVSAIAAKAGNNATLMAILGFPVVIPILLTLIKLSANALRILQDTDYGGDIAILLAIDGLLFGVALVLFPFVWRD